MSDSPELKAVIQALLLAAEQPLSTEKLVALLDDPDTQGALFEPPDGRTVRAVCETLQTELQDSALELIRVASGWRMQVRQLYAPWVARLFEERPQRYSRALLETLAIIAYRQPVTRGEIEEIRGVAVSSNIARSLTERGWIKVLGHRETPGRPALYGTTKEFLDYFSLKSLDELPELAELKDIGPMNAELELHAPTEFETENELVTETLVSEIDAEEAEASAESEAAEVIGNDSNV